MENPNPGRSEGDNEVDADIEEIIYPTKISPFDGKPNFDDLDEITRDKLQNEAEEVAKDYKQESENI